MQPFIDRVTATGADDSVQPEALLELAQRIPYLEFGILINKHTTGTKEPAFGRHRYPSIAWQERLASVCAAHPGVLKLSCHLTGQWVRDVFMGDSDEVEEMCFLWPHFQRMQLNTHAETHRAHFTRFPFLLERLTKHREVIFQADGVNEHLWKHYKAMPNVAALADLSHGAGVVPRDWCRPWIGRSGYAGGLGWQNVTFHLDRIERIHVIGLGGGATGVGPGWIDAETRLFDHEGRFDLNEVEKYARAAGPWVIPLAGAPT